MSKWKIRKKHKIKIREIDNNLPNIVFFFFSYAVFIMDQLNMDQTLSQIF